MTKNELAEHVARRNGLSASQARQVLETTIEAVSDEKIAHPDHRRVALPAGRR